MDKKFEHSLFYGDGKYWPLHTQAYRDAVNRWPNQYSSVTVGCSSNVDSRLSLFFPVFPLLKHWTKWTSPLSAKNVNSNSTCSTKENHDREGTTPHPPNIYRVTSHNLKKMQRLNTQNIFNNSCWFHPLPPKSCDSPCEASSKKPDPEVAGSISALTTNPAEAVSR